MITSIDDFKNAQYFINESEEVLNIEPSIIEAIVSIVGSEEDVEECAKDAFEELKASFESGEASVEELESAEQLAIAALIIKLVEKGKIGPNEADKLIGDNID